VKVSITAKTKYMIRTILTKTLVLCCLVVSMVSLRAQGWEKKYCPDFMMPFTNVHPTADGNYLTTGYNLGLPLQQRYMKIDPNGNVLWSVNHDSISSFSSSHVTQTGGFVTVGYGGIDDQGRQTRVVLKTDANGQKEWIKVIATGSSDVGNTDIDTTNDGGYICTINSYDTIAGELRLYIKRLNSTGDVVWEHTYYDTDTARFSYVLRNAKDGGFLCTAQIRPSKIFMFKIDGLGNLLWEYEADSNVYITPVIAADGNILAGLTNYFTQEKSIAKFNQQGVMLWNNQFSADSTWAYGDFLERDDHTLAFMAARYNYVKKFALVIADTLGNTLLHNTLPVGNLGSNIGLYFAGHKTFTKTHDGGYMVGGWVTQDPNNYSGFIIKMDSVGNVFPTLLSGNVYADYNEDCARDTTEPYLVPTIVTFTGADTFTIATYDSGYYSLGLNVGNYAIAVTPPSPYWQPSSCNPANVNLAAGADTSISFGLKPIVSSPYIVIDGHLGRQRLCSPSTYTAQYCNTGTAPFSGVLELTLDTLITALDSTSAPIIAQNGNVYYFDITNLDVMECATVELYYTSTCDVNLMGHTVCIDAHVELDTVLNVSPLWDESNLQMSVAFENTTDSITFTLKNIGTGSMNNPKGMIVIEDNVILMSEPVQLTANAELIKKIKANGSTFRATAYQTDYNPYSEFTTTAVENLGVNQQGGVSLGYIVDFPYNGFYGYNNTACKEIVGSYDPNHKSVIPEGAGGLHLVDSNVTLEYSIEFQNTGTDTAFFVRLVDTLAPYLDPSTIKKGASSHPCTMQLLGNVLTFTFYNILLPDSGANQSASNGFVNFTIKQKPGNTNGTVINNEAGIYFDYNPAIITNTAMVTVGKLQVTDVENLYAEKQILIKTYPNPFQTSTIIKVEGEAFDNIQLSVYDLTGRLIKQQHAIHTNQFILDRSGLTNGNYIFEITTNGKPVGRGKLVAQ
jgi:hypothetical protein